MTENELLKALQDDGKYGLLALASLMMQEEKEDILRMKQQRVRYGMSDTFVLLSFSMTQREMFKRPLKTVIPFSFVEIAKVSKLPIQTKKIMAMIISYLGIEGEINQEHIRNMMMSIAQRSPEAIVHILFHTNPETQTEKAKMMFLLS